ncbi:hypothetical protein OTU49_014050 [Cherax quadricarinatus]|uniref:Hypoxia up-regulated protein 1 n=2 Tax=Cherax quadricarinatus TaxID=27406 RepID=A0AAW0VRE0_CHEQU
MVKEELNYTVTYKDIPDLSPQHLKESKKKLEGINAAESARHEKEAARNTLESYILDAQDKLWQAEYEAASTEEQRTAIREMCSVLDEWIYDEGFDQDASVYKEKLGLLSKLFGPIKERVQEHRDRPEAIQARTTLILIYLSLSLLCMLVLLCIHTFKKRELAVPGQHYKSEGRWFTVTEKLYALGLHIWTYFNMVGNIYKGKGRPLTENNKTIDAQASRENAKSQRGGSRHLRTRNLSRHLKNR